MSAVLITGCSAAGKSTIAAVLARRGLVALDADDDPLLARFVDAAGAVVAEEPAAPDLTFPHGSAQRAIKDIGARCDAVYSAFMNNAGAAPELAGPADLSSLVVTFADAFSSDAMIRWPLPDATPEILREHFRVWLTPYVELGVLWKIHGCDGGAAWLPPAVVERFAEIELATRAAIHSLTSDDGVRYAAFEDWLGMQMPDEPCWFLDLVAVAPAVQGQGPGRH